MHIYIAKHLYSYSQLCNNISIYLRKNERKAEGLASATTTISMLASLLWFFSLAYGAGKLAPLFRHPRAWQVLDILIGCVMWIIAGTLINSGLHM